MFIKRRKDNFIYLQNQNKINYLASIQKENIEMSYRNLIFDLDGTLTNPYKGILNSMQYALQQLNYQSIPNTVPNEFVGPPLQKSFKEIFDLNDKQTKLAVEYFREYYGKAGLYENEPYEGILELFENLYDSGYKLFIATSKLEKYAHILHTFNRTEFKVRWTTSF